MTETPQSYGTHTAQNPCICRNYRTESGAGTGCSATTTRIFARGHDARLKGFLIEAGSRGEMVYTGSVTRTAVQAASPFGFYLQVVRGITSRTGSLPDLGLEPATPSEAPEGVSEDLDTASAPEVVTARVGRWEYTGEVRDGVFHYTDRKGSAKTAQVYQVLSRA